MIRRPFWFGAGIAAGVAGTVWAERRVRQQVRRAMDAISPSAAGQEAVRTAREATARLQLALDAARNERRRREAELWHRLGEVPRGVSAGSLAARQLGSSQTQGLRRTTGTPARVVSTRSSSPRSRRQHR